MTRNSIFLSVIASTALVACETGVPNAELTFLDGRAVAPANDSIYAFTARGIPGVLIHHRITHQLDTLGAEELVSPVHTQWVDGEWYVSDVVDGQPWIVVFDSDGTVGRRIDLTGIASAPHQFAVLPDGRIVVEAADGNLIALQGDSVVTFALSEGSQRTGLVVAARGGVLHAVADRLITLYNGQGNIRWRLEWPWDDSIYAVDLSVDHQGRTHLLAGQAAAESFIVFGFAQSTGEVVRWSQEGLSSTFVVGRMGEIFPDSASNWTGGR